MDRVGWLRDSRLTSAAALVTNLRRTNLVRKAYSQFHHQSQPHTPLPPLPPQYASTTPEEQLQLDEHGAGRSFGLAELLRRVWHDGIGDQEFASGSALRAAGAIGGQLLVVRVRCNTPCVPPHGIAFNCIHHCTHSRTR